MKTEIENIILEYGNRLLDVANGKENPTLGELIDVPTDKILALKSKWEREAKIDEWKPLLTAKINLSASPAPFNPEGLPVNTPETEEMTKLLQNYASDRIKELGDK